MMLRSFPNWTTTDVHWESIV